MASTTSGTKRREPNFSEEERVCLLQFVQQHKAKLLGKAGRPGHGDDKVEEREAKYWRMCALSLKAAGGRERDWKKVRKQWFDLKDKAKRLKSQTHLTGGGPKPLSTPSIELAMKVVAREALDGIRSKSTEVGPLEGDSVEMSQESSQESQPSASPSTSVPIPACTSASTSASASASASASILPPGEETSLQQQVYQLQSQVEMMGAGQPSSPQSGSELRQLKLQEELLALERRKVAIMEESLQVQKKQLAALEALGVNSLLHSMTEQ